MVGHVWERAIMPHCRRLCSAILGGGRRGRPGERGRVNLSQLLIGRLLLAAVVRRLLVTSKGNNALSLTWYAVPQFILSPLQCSNATAIFEL